MADLVISGIDLPSASIRGVRQTLDPLDQATHIMRTVNGAALDLSVPQFRKYRSTITCDDQQVPALDGVWPGQVVTVDCVAELSYRTVGGMPARTVVSSRVDGEFTFYRPRLTMIVVGYSVDHDEWGASESWQLELEEA